jgi:hypothetical protein
VALTVPNHSAPTTQQSESYAANLTTHVSPHTAPQRTIEPSPNSDSDSSTDLYFRAQANLRPEMGESNAESVLREKQVKQDVKRMRRERKSQNAQGKKIRHKTTLRNNVTEVNLHTDYHLYENLLNQHLSHLRYRSSDLYALL